MAFELGCNVKKFGRADFNDALEQAFGRHDSADHSCARRTHSPTVRNDVVRFDVQTRHLLAETIEGELDALDHQIVFVGCHFAGTFAGYLNQNLVASDSLDF